MKNSVDRHLPSLVKITSNTRGMKKLIIGLAVSVLIIESCTNNRPVNPVSSATSTPKEAVVLIDSLVYSIATFQSENSDSLENEAFNLFLKEKLINYVFDQLYAGKIKAYDFLSNKELTIKEIKNIEKTEGYSRSKVGKIQFNEQWYVAKDGAINKRINSMTLGLEHYSNQGNFINYTALFKVKF